MFTPQRLVYRVLDHSDAIRLGSALPKKSNASIERVKFSYNRSGVLTEDYYLSGVLTEDMVVFVDPEDPAKVCNDPLVRSLLDSCSDSVFVTNPDGKKVLRNSFGEELCRSN